MDETAKDGNGNYDSINHATGSHRDVNLRKGEKRKMKITVELTEKEKEELRVRTREIEQVVAKIADSKLWGEGRDAGYQPPELKSAVNWLWRAKDKIQYLTELDVVDNDA